MIFGIVWGEERPISGLPAFFASAARGTCSPHALARQWNRVRSLPSCTARSGTHSGAMVKVLPAAARTGVTELLALFSRRRFELYSSTTASARPALAMGGLISRFGILAENRARHGSRGPPTVVLKYRVTEKRTMPSQGGGARNERTTCEMTWQRIHVAVLLARVARLLLGDAHDPGRLRPLAFGALSAQWERRSPNIDQIRGEVGWATINLGAPGLSRIPSYLTIMPDGKLIAGLGSGIPLGETVGRSGNGQSTFEMQSRPSPKGHYQTLFRRRPPTPSSWDRGSCPRFSAQVAPPGG